MKVTINNKFYKDVKKLDKIAQLKAIDIIESLLKGTKVVSDYDNKNMIGYKNYFRIRFGEYRIGYKKNDNEIEIKRVAKRDEIYKIFP